LPEKRSAPRSSALTDFRLTHILRSGDKAAIGLITEHVYTAQLRAAVIKLMDQAA
jgi:hypothetical protein